MVYHRKQLDQSSGLFGADVLAKHDYYAFGMEMPGRSYEDGYRYGFNGKEKDNSFGATSYDYGFRIYNPQIAKFLSVDPLTKSYPELTPYQFASNRPVDGIDIDGLEGISYMLTQTFGGVGTTEVNANIEGGAALFGLSLQGAMGIAYDEYDNIAIYGNYGGFADLFGTFDGASYDGNPRETGEFNLGADIGIGVSESYLPGLNSVLDIADDNLTHSFDVFIANFTVVSNKKEEVLGAGIGAGASIGLSVGATRSTAKYFAFNTKDIGLLKEAYDKANSYILDNAGSGSDFEMRLTTFPGDNGSTDIIFSVTEEFNINNEKVRGSRTFETGVSYRSTENGAKTNNVKDKK